MCKNRFHLVEGSYIGKEDDKKGRWYVVDREQPVMDKSGDGYSYEFAERVAANLNGRGILYQLLHGGCCG